MAARLASYLVVGIVAVTLIAGLIVGAQRDDSVGPVDLIVHNATVYTADGSGRTAEAVAIRGNQILRVGSNREIEQLRRPQTTMIDANGGAVLPGFNDAHVALVDGGLMLGRIDLLGAATLDEVQGRLTTWGNANPGARWLVGAGWDDAAFTGGDARRQALDAVAGDRPVLLASADRAAAWVNSAALRVAGITRQTPSPAGGTIVKDPRTGEPTGVLRGAAVALVSDRVPRADRTERADAVRAAVTEAHRLGVTSVHDVGATAGDMAVYDELRRAGDLDLRVYAALAVEGAVDEGVLATLGALWKQFADDPLLKTGAVVMDLDAAAGQPAAADGVLPPAPAEPAIARDDLNRYARLLDAKGWQVLTDAGSDLTVRMALDAYVHAARSNPSPERRRRHRVEGAASAADADRSRFQVIGVLASVRPDAARAGDIAALDADEARLVFGSRWPSATLDPMRNLHAAVAEGAPVSGAPPRPRMTLASAVDAYTANGAFASYDEQRKGRLAAGMLADLVVLSDDIFAAPAARLASTSVAFTIFDGKIVYRRDARVSHAN